MAIGRSKVTSQGQISVPAEVRKRLEVGQGSTLVWDDDGNRTGTKTESLKQLKEGLRGYVRKRYARG